MPATITESQLHLQRKFIAEQLDAPRAELYNCRAQERAMIENRILMENIVALAAKTGGPLDHVPSGQRGDIFKLPL